MTGEELVEGFGTSVTSEVGLQVRRRSHRFRMAAMRTRRAEKLSLAGETSLEVVEVVVVVATFEFVASGRYPIICTCVTREESLQEDC